MESGAYCSVVSSSDDDERSPRNWVFEDDLRDLSNLRKQFYAAAEYFELSYQKEDHKQILLSDLKDYAVKSFIHTVDHLGFLSNDVNQILDDSFGVVSETELQVSCMEQRLKAHQDYFSQGCLYKESLAVHFPKYDKHYVLHENEAVSPDPFSFTHSPSLASKSTFTNSSDANHPLDTPQNRKIVTICACPERETRKEIGPNFSMRKRLLKALLKYAKTSH